MTPPPELVRQWTTSFDCPEVWGPKDQWIAIKAAQWGADLELEGCTAWLRDRGSSYALALYAARRPKPSSLKEQALETLKYPKDLWSESEVDTIRRALETLPNE